MTTTAQIVDDFEQRIMRMVRDANEMPRDGAAPVTCDQFASAVARVAAIAFPALIKDMAAEGRPDLAAKVAVEVARRAAAA